MRLTYKNRSFFLYKNNKRKVISNLKKVCKLYKYADRETKKKLDRVRIKRRKIPPWSFPKGKSPLPFQPPAIDWVLSRSRSYLAAYMGAGKTAISYTCIDARPGKTLIICPPYLVPVWLEEKETWAKGDYKVLAIQDDSWSMEDFDQSDIVIVPDSRIAAFKGIIRDYKWKWIFIDEAHRVNREATGRGAAIWDSPKKRKNRLPLPRCAENFVLLSATPDPTRAMDLWPALNLCAPEAIDFMNKHEYGMRYCGGMMNEFGKYSYDGVSNYEELVKRMTKKFMFVIPKDVVKAHLPPLREEIIYIGEKQIGRKQNKIRTLEDMLRSKYPDPQDMIRYARSEDPAISEFRSLVGAAKTQFAVDFIKGLLETSSEKMVLFTTSRAVAEVLEDDLKSYGCLRVDGSVGNPVKKKKIIEQFQSSKKHRALAANIASVGLGYTITKPTIAVFVEYEWTEAANSQARDRLHRTGQKSPVTAYYLVLRNTLDEYILKKVLKRRQISDVLHTKGSTYGRAKRISS